MKSILFSLFLLSSLFAQAQTETKKQLVGEYLELDGFLGRQQFMITNLLEGIKAERPDIPDSIWLQLENHLLLEFALESSKSLRALIDQSFTEAELGEIVGFYKSETGKKYLAKRAELNDESVSIGNQVAGQVSQEIVVFLRDNGFLDYGLDRLDCARFRVGSFRSYLGNGTEIITTKTEDSQVSKFGGYYVKYDLKNLNDCEYTLTLVETDFETLKERIGTTYVVIPYEINGNTLRYKLKDINNPESQGSVGILTIIE